MEKVPSFEMDMEEWELLPEDGLFSGKVMLSKEMPFNPKGSVHMDYFICPSDPDKLLESVDDLSMTKSNWKQSTVPDPIKTNPTAVKDFSDEEFVKEIKEINVVPPPPPPMNVEDDRDVISKVCCDKLEEQEFADMTKDTEKTQYESEGVEREKINKDVKYEEEEEKYVCSVEKGRGCWDGFGFSMWRWRLTGIGALCSIGVAAATMCIFVLGGHQRQKQHHQNQKLQFQIYPDEKNLKQVVQHATRLNQAMSAVRGVPVPRANISFGGYYDGL